MKIEGAPVKAIRYHEFGRTVFLQEEDVQRPTPAAGKLAGKTIIAVG